MTDTIDKLFSSPRLLLGEDDALEIKDVLTRIYMQRGNRNAER
jgi:hypothetical protein